MIRAIVAIGVITAQCGGDDIFGDISPEFSRGGKSCGPETVAMATVYAEDGSIAYGPEVCDDNMPTIPAKHIEKTFAAAATNAQGTLCFFQRTSQFDVDGKTAAMDIPALEPKCASDTMCPEHVAAMNPIYQFGLELTGDSTALCGKSIPITVVQLIQSGGVFTAAPAGDHTEGQLVFGMKVVISPTVLESRVITNPAPSEMTHNLYDAAGRYIFAGVTLDFRRTPTPISLVPAVVDPPPGEYFIFAQVLKGPLPERDPTNYYQYAFVFDSDGNTTNNYTPLPQYPADFFKDTDRWYELNYTPTAGWTTKVSTANGTQIRPAQSDAQVYAIGSTIMLLVPASEFAVPNPSYRVTAFRHKGDYGMNPPHDFSGYVDPPVADGLHAFTP